MVRVAILFEFGSLNGGEHSMLTALDHLADGALADGSFEFVAITPPEGRLLDAIQERGMQQLSLSLRDGSGNRLPRDEVCQRIEDVVEQIAPDILHANSLSMGRLTGAIADRIKPRCISHLRDIMKLSRAAIDDLNRNDRLIAVSSATRNYHIEQGMQADRVCVLHNGVDCDRFRPRESCGSLRHELGLPAGSFLIATIGQIGLRKGQDVLAKAAALAADQLPMVHYLVIGERLSSKAESIEFERSLLTCFDSAGLGDRLHVLGYRDDIDHLMNEVDLLVHPAHQEPLGRVLLEAAASGLPVIATAVGGTEEILRNDESARLIAPGDASSLAAAIIDLHEDSAKAQRFAVAARQRIETAFDVRQAADQLAAVWRGR